MNMKAKAIGTLARPCPQTLADGSIGWTVELFAGETIAAVIAVSGGIAAAVALADEINSVAVYIDGGHCDWIDAAIARAHAVRDLRRLVPRGADPIMDNFRAAIAQLSAISLLKKQAG